MTAESNAIWHYTIWEQEVTSDGTSDTSMSYLIDFCNESIESAEITEQKPQFAKVLGI